MGGLKLALRTLLKGADLTSYASKLGAEGSELTKELLERIGKSRRLLGGGNYLILNNRGGGGGGWGCYLCWCCCYLSSSGGLGFLRSGFLSGFLCFGHFIIYISHIFLSCLGPIIIYWLDYGL